MYLKDSRMEPNQVGTIVIHCNNLNETGDTENGKVVHRLLRWKVKYTEYYIEYGRMIKKCQLCFLDVWLAKPEGCYSDIMRTEKRSRLGSGNGEWFHAYQICSTETSFQLRGLDFMLLITQENITIMHRFVI